MPLCRHKRNEFTRNSSVNTRPQSSQIAEPLWINPDIKSEICTRELIFTVKKAQAGTEWFEQFASEEKSH